jgi:acyl-coenzyme A synthetase/AMP-(fatty) acid ligase
MKSPKSIGYANPGSVKLYIVDPDGIPVDCYAAGELCIAGPQLALGYFNRPDLTAEKFVLNKFSRSPETPVMYRTGDLCRWLSDGSVEYIGRIDSQVKLRGFRIELGEIESKVLEDDDIRACAVALKNRKSPEKAPFLCAYLVPAKAASDIDLSSVRVRLVTSLPDYMIPAAFMILESIPTDLNGKTDRRQLPDPEQTNFFCVSNPQKKDTESSVIDN